jgi:U3 small nucleolar RNA-associated protein 20
VSQQLLDIDPLVQRTALNVLRLFKIEWLNPYLESLIRLVDNKTLRSELTAFPLAKDCSGVRAEDAVLEILPEHRKDFVPVLIACLFPKMRKRSGRLGGKGKKKIFRMLFGRLFGFPIWHSSLKFMRCRFISQVHQDLLESPY